jgi:hypothetical protein
LEKRVLPGTNAIRFSTCALSGEPLRTPVVADELGSIFNKDAIIQYVLEQRSIPQFSHIKSLKRDLIPMRPTPNPRYIESDVAVEGGKGEAPFICPITGLEANGQHGFVLFRSCGCVLSERAVKEMMAKGAGACPACSAACGPESIVKLCPTEEESDLLRARLAVKRLAAAAAKAAVSAAGAAAPVLLMDPAESTAVPTGSKRTRSERDTPPTAVAAAAAVLPVHHSSSHAAAASTHHHAVVSSSAHGSGGTLIAAAADAALEAIEARKRGSKVFAGLLRPQGAERAGQTEGQRAENLFIRTTTSIYTKNRGAF